MTKHYLFIQYRRDMIFDEHAVYAIEYHGMIQGDMNALVQMGSVTYPKGQGATPQHHDSSASAFTSMKCIEPIVPRYVTPGSTFVTFAHNYDHTRHHLQDHRKAIEVLEMLDCIEDDLVIVECVFGRDNTQVAVKEHSFDSYFGR